MKISVCLITHNGEKYLKEQIDSILPQLGSEDELIISDDNSQDSTISIINEYKDERIVLLKENNFHSPTLNMENALKPAKGDYIFMSDQDDVWLPDKVSVMFSYLKDYDYVVSDCYVVDENLQMLYNTRFYNGANITKNRWKALFYPTAYQGSCAAFNRKVLNKALPFPEEIQSHDRWIGFVASFFFKYKIIPEKLIYYRRHSQNVSSAVTGKSHNSMSYRIKCRVSYIHSLLRLCLHFQKKNE